MRGTAHRESDAVGDVVALLETLIRIDSQNPPGNEGRVVDAIAQRLERARVPFAAQAVADGRSNLLATLGTGNGPHLLFTGHADTVPVGKAPWRHDPLAGEFVDGRVYGRGAADMKGGLAAMVVALERLAAGPRPAGRVSLLVTAGEEVDCVGAQAFRDGHGVEGIGALVVGEPTGMRVANAHKGALWGEVRCFGKTAHGAQPRHGVNAIDALLDAAQMLRQEQRTIEAGTTAAITRIAGGIRTNVIPDEAFLEMDIRSDGDAGRALWERCRDRLARRQAKNERFRFATRVLLQRAPVRTPADHPLIALAMELTGTTAPVTVPYYTDGSVLAAPDAIPTLILGPGETELAHQPDEWVDVTSLARAARVYHRLALGYLERAT